MQALSTAMVQMNPDITTVDATLNLVQRVLNLLMPLVNVDELDVNLLQVRK
jgi:hypothetical protein